jgi:small neutral amino acid transporter SnatA (MarC family)
VTTAAMANEDRKKVNLRLALILASVALVFFLGFIAKMAFFG